ncbi:hypothetical protein CMK14_07120 [Candidatus Poribacteria bacterium]|nr:hypothetical protein [Candidatus Poribacteria bacterium]
MKRIWIYLFVIFWLVPDAISQTGQIRGKIFDFRQNQLLVGQLIVLERHQAEQTSRRETETDAEGHYRFQNLEPSSTDHYTVFTEFEGRTYREENVIVTNLASNVTVDLNLNAFTSDLSVMRILRHSIFLQPVPDHVHGEAVHVLEFLSLENRSNLNFQQEFEGKILGCLLPLPSGIEQLQVGISTVEIMEEVAENPVVIPAPILPGKTNIQISYLLHINQVVDLSRLQQFQTESLQLLIPESVPLVVQSKDLEAKTPQTIHNTVYATYETARLIAAGRAVQLQLKLDRSSSTLFIVLIAGLAICIVGFVITMVIHIQKPGQTDPVELETPDRQPDVSWLRKSNVSDLAAVKAIRLEFITRLDEMRQQEKVSERVYNRVRREQVERLEATIAQMQE